MTLKEALKERKKATAEKRDSGFWKVRVEVKVVEQVHIVEYVKASSVLEAQAVALKQFNRRTPKFIHDRAKRDWRNDNRHSLQHLQIAETKKSKKFSVSEKQREILKELIKGKYLDCSYGRWRLVDPTSKKNLYAALVSVPGISVDSLFQKGLLIDLATANMSDKEVEIQDALGSLPELKAYTIDMARVKTLGLRL